MNGLLVNNIDILSLDSIKKPILNILYLTFRETGENANEIEIGNDSGPELIEHFESWINNENRLISNSAIKCARRFIQTEMDTKTLGNRGVGRLTDNFPRFGARFRKLLPTLDSKVLSEMELLLTRLVICGYLFAEYIIKLKLNIELTRDSGMENPDRLFTKWVPIIYSEEGIPAFDNKMKDSFYVQFKELWKNASSMIVVDFMKNYFEKDNYIFMALDSYFNAGILLRLTECSPPDSTTKTQVQIKNEISINSVNHKLKREINFIKIGIFFFIPFFLIFVGTYEKAGANAISNSIFGGAFWCMILSLIFGYRKK